MVMVMMTVGVVVVVYRVHPGKGTSSYGGFSSYDFGRCGHEVLHPMIFCGHEIFHPTIIAQ